MVANKVKKPGTKLVKWDEALAARAQIAKKAEESVATGSFISLKSGIMTYNGNPVTGNKLDVVVIDSIMENKHYSSKYDANNPGSPTCYAFGRTEDTMAPHEQAELPVSEACAGCPNNEWGSGDEGRGKACKNVRRLAVISADALDDGADGVDEATVAYIELPVTSVKAWAGYVNQLVATANKPPLAFVTEVSLSPDTKTQFKVSFKAKEAIEDGELIGALLAKADVVEQSIAFPYTPNPAEARPSRRRPAPARKPVAQAKPAARKPAAFAKPAARKF